MKKRETLADCLDALRAAIPDYDDVRLLVIEWVISRCDVSDAAIVVAGTPREVAALVTRWRRAR